MAAGVLLKRRDGRVLMIKEIRRGRDKYNFIGGKRECRLDWFNLARLEQSFETASTEFEEETGQRLPSTSYQSVYWFPDSKYLLFVVNGEIKDHSSRLEWFANEEIQKGIDGSIYHDYMNFYLQRILESNKTYV